MSNTILHAFSFTNKLAGTRLAAVLSGSERKTSNETAQSSF